MHWTLRTVVVCTEAPAWVSLKDFIANAPADTDTSAPEKNTMNTMKNSSQSMRLVMIAAAIGLMAGITTQAAEKPLKVFILAGDENMLEQAPIDGAAGSLAATVKENPRYAFLKDPKDEWVRRDDVILYDVQPLHNNTKTMGRFLQVGDISYGGKRVSNAIGTDLMFGHVMGNHFDEPVLLLRFAVREGKGSRSLGHDYRPPSGGGGPDLAGGWDVIHFNWGVWDTYYLDKATRKLDKTKGQPITPIDVYEKNLRELVKRMKKTGATLIWASTTPFHEDCPANFKDDAPKYNAVAKKIMDENGVIIDDLYSETIRQGFPKRADVHSVGTLAPKVTETILAALAARKNSTKPLPRVLLIGDSITGSYEQQVTAKLDGKAAVFKNPGNGEHTGTGLAKIEEWLDLKKYLLNGQEYLELVSGVNDALTNLNRVVPDYKNQGYKLEGFVWFQGIKDIKSQSMANQYENNLANLIRDARKDLNAPNLPFLVGAFGVREGPGMDPKLIKMVHDAQMAVGDEKKYPEFAGNVKSIDTIELSRGAGSMHYNNNAEVFLEIGEAMANAMLQLTKDKK